MNKKQKTNLIKIIITIVLLVIIHFLNIKGGLYKFLLYLIPYVIIGYSVIKKAIKGIINLKPLDENLLMMVATVGALIIAYIKKEDYLEAIAVMLFYNIGELFQNYAVHKSRNNILDLIDICPEYAKIEDSDKKLIKVDPSEVKVGDYIIVSPGEKIAIDGVVEEGSSVLNTSSLTGEAALKPVKKGDIVLSGCINLNGVLKVKTTKDFSDSTAYKILELIEDATSKKTKTEVFITRFSRIYTPVVVFLSFSLGVIVPSFIFLVFKKITFTTWTYRALTFLVISCPCALMVSVPLSFFAGIGSLSRKGVLIKGSNYLELLSKAKTVIFDKTGTLTKGAFLVSEVHSIDEEEKKLLHIASHVERYSTHPIAIALKKAFQSEGDSCNVEKIEEIFGKGIKAIINGKIVYVGNKELMIDKNISIKKCENDDGTIVHLAIDNRYIGHILVTDIIKDSSFDAIKMLKQVGIKRTVMLTGDNKKTADLIAKKVGIKEVYYDLLPNEKVSMFEKIKSLNESNNYKTIFVGDGINDAPVLTRADIGISMGSMGSDVAIEASDVVLMDDDPMKISFAIKVAKKCMLIVKENIYISIGVKLIVLLFGALGFTNMWAAVFSDVGVMVLAVLNAIRCMFIKD